MNIEEINKLEQEIKNNYNGNDIAIEFTGAVDFFYQIHNLKSLVSQQTILLSNGKFEELRIQVDMITYIEICEKCIIFKMFDNYKIEIRVTDEKDEGECKNEDI